MTKDEKQRKYCNGCYNNFYNGNNELGVKVCWSLKDSRVVWRVVVSIRQPPPWRQKPQRVLNCCHRTGFAMIDPKTIGKDGFQRW